MGQKPVYLEVAVFKELVIYLFLKITWAGIHLSYYMINCKKNLIMYENW